MLKVNQLTTMPTHINDQDYTDTSPQPHQEVSEPESTTTEQLREQARTEPITTENQQQPTNQNMETQNTPRIAKIPKTLVIGLGGAGNNNIQALYQENINENISYLAINAADGDMSKLNSAIQKIGFGDGFGAGMDAQLGYEMFKECGVINEILDIIKQYDLIIFTFGFGGGSGVGSSQFILENCRDINKPIFVIATEPFEREGKEQQTKEWEDKMKDLPFVNYDIVQMDKVKEQFAGNATLTSSGILNICTLQVANSIDALCSVIYTDNTVQNIDFADIKRAMKGGRVLIFTAKAKTLLEAREKALDQVRFRQEQTLDNFGIILANVRTKHEIFDRDIDETYQSFKTKNNNYLVKFGHDSQVDHEDYEIQIVLGGQPKPKVLQSQIPKGIKDLAAKYMNK
jgi:cell division GTPase FtsZ